MSVNDVRVDIGRRGADRAFQIGHQLPLAKKGQTAAFARGSPSVFRPGDCFWAVRSAPFWCWPK